MVVANNMFEQAVTSSKNICHNDQPSLKQIVTNCKRRAIGTNGGFGFKAMMEEHEIALLDSVILAHWACATYKGVKKKTKNKLLSERKFVFFMQITLLTVNRRNTNE